MDNKTKGTVLRTSIVSYSRIKGMNGYLLVLFTADIHKINGVVKCVVIILKL